ncbi:FecR family protein [Mucilaginibacter paludis]|uniref:Anti-FecI sigma factor, FecR n=1 Tax=Mucilaginibacter paludis DSM 18603 TaxID=714943 RepID=H1YE35_9SPHI|nr:FecR domain-containing protein [Mucilaginibacter paludis]EHQ25213.1 anti-FecI sigma factor, FecR [Mucilaginibacter paludis DSM 18603]
MSTNTRFEYLFQKYLDHLCTDSERLELMAMIDDEANEQQLSLLMELAWDNQESTIALSQQRARELFAQVINNNNRTVNEDAAPRNRSWFKWAAAAVAALGIAISAVYFSADKTHTAPALLAKTTTEHQLIKLPDGSTVVLNKSSYLTYPAGFTGKTREVNLVGEGYFDIRHDAAHPFIVHTGKLFTTVLGTAFNIKAYSQEKNITVTVTRGKVSVSNSQQVLGVITPNQQIAFDKNAQNMVQLNVNSEKVVEWQSKDLFLTDVTMLQAAQTLEQRFNVKITFANDAVKNCRFTGTFLHGEKFTDILQVICDFNNATSKAVDAEHYIINGAGCP